MLEAMRLPARRPWFLTAESRYRCQLGEDECKRFGHEQASTGHFAPGLARRSFRTGRADNGA